MSEFDVHIREFQSAQSAIRAIEVSLWEIRFTYGQLRRQARALEYEAFGFLLWVIAVVIVFGVSFQAFMAGR